MKDYISACGLSLQRIENTHVPRLILGHLPFIGESCQVPEKNREYANRFSGIENTMKIVRMAVEKYGLTVTAARITPNNQLTGLFFEAMKETERSARMFALFRKM